MSQSARPEISLLNINDVEDIQFPPGDLLSDEPPLETDFHRDQIDLLIRLLKWWWRDRQDFYVSGNLTIYYNQRQLKSRDFRGLTFSSCWVQKRRIAKAGWCGKKKANTLM